MSARLLQLTDGDWEILARKAAFQPGVMAALLPLSLRQLQRHFAEHFKKSPKKWTQELRCRDALALLQSGMSGKAAAAEVHFAHPSQLSREFRKMYGRTPQSFNLRWQKDDSSGMGMENPS